MIARVNGGALIKRWRRKTFLLRQHSITVESLDNHGVKIIFSTDDFGC